MTTPKKKPPRPRRKFILIEVDTRLTNLEVRRVVQIGRVPGVIREVHVNTAQEVSRG